MDELKTLFAELRGMGLGQVVELIEKQDRTISDLRSTVDHIRTDTAIACRRLACEDCAEKIGMTFAK